jgi:serine/threonine protein kinase/WD40 repeat protein
MFMNTAASCRKCGAPATADARDGICPKCLFNLAGAGASPIESADTAGLQQSVLHSFGDYELLEEIARGGMGVVYKARQKSLGRVVAVKLILAGQFAGKQIAQRFKSEAIAAAVLQHPNIVAVHEVGVHDGHHFFSMDYVEGQNLAERVAQRPLPPRTAARYVKLIAEAIHYAHGQGILHRDLKPSNVLIDAATDQPRVTDFGLAKRLDGESSLTVTGQVLGSPHFMPPEQAGRGWGKVGRASDVFGLGGILYFLLTARAPFQGETMEATIEQVFHADPVSPRLLNATAPLDLETICLKCLEKEPGRRYQTAEEVVEELERFLSGEPILARPISRVEQAWRWCRRKPAIAALATATILLLLAVVIGSPISLYRIQESARRARHLLYASDMNLAQQALKLNNLGKARRLLDRHRPHLGEEDLRGWEWRYLWQLTRGSEHTTLTNRPTPGFSVGFSTDGKRLAVGWWDGRVDLWDVPARRWVRALTDGERPHPGRVAFSPVRNLLAATSRPNAVTLYDLDSGRESILWRVTDQGGWDVRDLAFSQDGSKLVIYTGSNPEADDAVWVVGVASSRIENRYSAGSSRKEYAHTGAARLSPDNRRLYLTRSDYLNHRYSIQCIDLSTSKELWQTESQDDTYGAIALDISPDGRVLASASGFEHTTIHIWDTATGKLLKRLDRHTAFVLDLAFTRDGRRLVSAAGDQTIRFWDTSTWAESQEPLRGHAGEVWAIAISEPEQLIASVSKDGDLKLWTKHGKGAADGYRRLSETLGVNDVQSLDHSRVLLLPQGQPPELLDLKRDSPPVPLPQIGSCTNVLGCFGTNLLCLWNGTNQILVGELRGAEFVERWAFTLDSGMRPTGLAYNPERRLLAWSEGTSSRSLYLANLTSAGLRIELRSDVSGLVPFRFSQDGKYLAATRQRETLRTWNVESGQMVAPINQNFNDACFAAKGSVLVVALHNRIRGEIGFYDLASPDRVPQCVPGGFFNTKLAVSPDGGLVSATSNDGQILLLDPALRKSIDSLRGHLIVACSSAFSPDGRRLFSTDRREEAVKLWDVGTRQELLTLAGTDSVLNGVPRWSADGNVILAGPPWQAWSAPSWEEIAAAEAKEKTESKKP